MSEKKKPQSDGELETRAVEIGQKVSSVAREVLEGTFDLVETVLLEGASAVTKAAERASTLTKPIAGRGARPAPKAAVIGWQRVVMNLNAVCERCNAVCPRGAEAAIGVTDRAGARRPVICVGCLDAIRDEG